MAKLSATASLGIKKSLEGKKGWGKYDSASPHVSFSIEREFSDDLTLEELDAKQEELHKFCEKRVQQKMTEEIKKINEMP